MKNKFKKLYTNWRVVLLVICLLLSFFLINPAFDTSGVAINHIGINSAASLAGLQSPTFQQSPRSQEIIESIDGTLIESIADFHEMTDNLQINDTLLVQTNREAYIITVRPELQFNATTNSTEILGAQDIGITVTDVATSNIRRGLDLQGGTRVLLEPEGTLSETDFESLQGTLEQRLNVFGLSDIRVAVIRNLPQALGGTPQFILVEIAGASIKEVEDLLSKQGKFEGKIGNTTVFIGGERDVIVQRGPQNSGILPSGCGQIEAGVFACSYFVNIRLSTEASQRQADVTSTLDIVPSNGQTYLSQPLDLFLDDELVNSLQIAADLRGRAVTDIQITGSGEGVNERTAREAAIADMKQMQSVLETGSLPVKINIVKADTISPLLGKSFVTNALFAGLLAGLAVAIVIFIRYRRLSVTIPVALILCAEVILVLGAAAFTNWNLDLAAIAGIIIVIGSSVDHQIVIIDETISGKSKLSWKKKLRKAFGIILGAYCTTIAAMIPLFAMGAGLLKGFAFTTIMGVSLGVFITRPAFAAIIEIFVGEE